MVSLNPLHLTQTAASCVLSAGYNGMKEGIKTHATKKNIAIVTTGAIGVGALMIHPVTRLALCTLLGLTATMTTLFLNLALVALSLVLIALQGVKSTVETGVFSGPSLFDTIKSFFGRKNSDSTLPTTNKTPQRQIQPEIPQETEELLNEFTSFQEASKNDPEISAAQFTQEEISKVYDEYQEKTSSDVIDLSELYDQFEKKQETVQENVNQFIKTITELSPDAKKRVARRLEMVFNQLVPPSKL